MSLKQKPRWIRWGVKTAVVFLIVSFVFSLLSYVCILTIEREAARGRDSGLGGAIVCSIPFFPLILSALPLYIFLDDFFGSPRGPASDHYFTFPKTMAIISPFYNLIQGFILGALIGFLVDLKRERKR